MGLFSMRRPRGFRHEYMFADKRKERLKTIEERAKAELGKQQSQSGGHEEIRGMFFDATRHARRRKERRLAGGIVLSYGVIVVLLVVLIAIWKMLVSL